MSLINDALVDLERRKAAESNSLDSVLASNGSLNAPRRRLALPVLFSLIIVLGTAWYLAPFDLQSIRDSDPKVTQQTPSPVHQTDDEKKNAAGERVDTVMTNPAEVASVDRVEKNEFQGSEMDSQRAQSLIKKKQLLISSLLRNAERALDDYRLTKPENNSAQFYFTEVLSLDSENLQALVGMEKIKSAYVDLYKNALDRNEKIKAEAYRKSLYALLTESEREHRQVQLAEIEQRKVLSNPDDYHDTKVTVDRPSIENPVPKETHTQKNRVSQVEPVSAELQIKKSDAQIERDFLLEIDAEIARGNIVSALSQLEDAVITQRFSTAVEERLFHLYFSNRDYPKALGMIDKLGSARARHAHLYAEATQLIYGQEAALNFLDGGYGDNSRAQAVHAGLLQQFERFSEAEKLYAELTKVVPANALYWLGLAVARDKQVLSESAVLAYRRALQLGGHTANVQKFIQQRIQALSNQGSKVELSQW